MESAKIAREGSLGANFECGILSVDAASSLESRLKACDPWRIGELLAE
jgi:hypothetical protein